MNHNSYIRLKGLRQNNLKNFDLEIPHHTLTVITGPSGSGKSSLAFETLYAEGQRRYVETFSPYTRQFLERMDKPQVESIEGIPPAIAIEQSNPIRTTRSTVGTMTEIADYLKQLFPNLAHLYCPQCQREIQPSNAQTIAQNLLSNPALKNREILITFTLSFPENTPLFEALNFVQTQGFRRLLWQNQILRLEEAQKQNGLLKSNQLILIQDRIKLDQSSSNTRLIEALEHALTFGKGLITIYRLNNQQVEDQPLLYSNRWHCPYDHLDFRAPTPALFTFNNPLGACPTCHGFGRTIEIDYDLVIPDKTKALAQGAIKPFRTGHSQECQADLLRACKKHKISTDIPYQQLTPEQKKFILEGEPSTLSRLEIWQKGGWYGVKGYFDWLETKTYKMHVRVLLSRYRAYQTCPVCHGGRFQPETLNWKLITPHHALSLAQINALSTHDALDFFKQLSLFPKLDDANTLLIKEITTRLTYLNEVGLGYLTLNRATRTLSGGEIQRVNLTTCLGTSLVNTLFILDEPSIGLHPRDTDRLTRILYHLRDLGNTVVVVEHEESIIRSADYLVDLGPGRGQQGGNLVFSGIAEKILSQKNSLTANYLSYRTRIPLPQKRRKISQENIISIFGATSHNLKNVDFTLPLNALVCLTGVSGSGKSTLAFDILYKNILKTRNEAVSESGEIKKIIGQDLINEVVLVDQSPLSKTPRSNPALYVGIYDAIRELFAATESAQSQGLNASAFSFNTGTGRCDRCQGMGYEKIEMQFLSDIYLPCSECHGQRFQPHVLRVRYHDKSVAEILAMTLDEAIEFFKIRKTDEMTTRGKANAHTIVEGLQLLCDVGLGYLTLGQPLNQLSGGEAQRIKLVSHLSATTSKKKKKSKGNLLILDEPTTGLHFDDVRILLTVLQRLVDAGHSLLVIEHNLEVIKSADWIIDMGPEGGEQGGKIIFEGTPEQVIETKNSHTGKFLKSIFSSKILKEKGLSPSPTRFESPTENTIQIRGARHHNLKNISLKIPLDNMTVITGLSGSGKSTLAFDIVFAEGQRRYLDSLNTYARQFVQQFEKPEVDLITGIPPTVAIEQNITRGGGKSTVGTVTEIHHFIRLLFSKLGVQHDPETGEKAVRQTVAGIQKQIDALLKKYKTLDVVAPLIKARKGFHTEIARWAEKKGFRLLRVDKKWIEPAKFKALDRYREHTIDVLTGTLLRKQKSGETVQLIHDSLKYGRGSFSVMTPQGEEILLSTHLFCPKSGRSFEELDPRQFSYNSPHGWCPTCEGFGIIFESSVDAESALEREVQRETKYEMSEDSEQKICPTCHGERLNSISRAVRFSGKTIGEISHLSVLEAKRFFDSLSLKGRTKEIARDIVPEILQRLHFLEQVGLNYLQLARSAKTLSGGESQRIRLAAQLGSNLEGVLYVLDEPTIGLHPRDNADLLKILKQLKAKGNSLLIVEHDEETMRQADHLIDLGPGAGTRGGEIMAQGSWQEIAKNTRSVTGTLLGEPLPHPLYGKRCDYNNAFWLQITGARANNLKSVDLKIPLNCLTVLCGVSGSGKSTLMREILLPTVQDTVQNRKKKKKITSKLWDKLEGAELITKVIEVDQSPIGKTSRSTPATYVGIFDLIRELFAQLPESRVRGYTSSRFSFNSKGGRCDACQGQGACKIEMNFLPTLHVPCEVCQGKRYNRETLEIKFKDKSIADCLAMTVEEAVIFFQAHPKIHRALKLLEETGLGYLTLGQSSPTLSGGEAQRLKLVTELARDNSGHCLYLLEEPTIGLHLADVKRLLEVVHRLIESGHTVVIIEHNLDVIAEADYVIEVGPEGGERGGRIVAQGSPEQILKHKHSITAPFLKPYIP
ncbi:MAG: excinuclease ABC subunit UvrA [Verrucomicrobiae bacterium]|nr:excinuclease ABC subunit UvrA [Verrucomicrobiae bacterium]